ncbi:ABC transporter ATP-binding protein [Neolewinella antarctica]|uniref:Cu-processing system ATP-binding protein n=1 Tax=Neolewinella antarctica TaxID=442734 RepID=A0ABX0XCI2_9BACT|nr:ABC transporter ATP-binding protein [Neolewinella antarctica]NJC26980.1 Cu-processing system ATP-binding protein [Neolewinella antarctica]
MIETFQLSKVYSRQEVLSGLNLRCEAGQSIALIGPNGAGKTTLSKIILGQVIASSGRVEVNGIDINRGPDYRRELGYMPQVSRFPVRMKTHQLFKLMRRLRPDVGEGEYDTELYEELEIDGMKNKALGALSGGMRQRVSAALAFYFNPRVLILDEPTAGLDPLANEVLKAKIRKCVREQRLVITTSHILNDLEEICNHVIYLLEGKVHFAGSIDELQERTGETRLNRMVVSLIKNKPARAQYQ